MPGRAPASWRELLEADRRPKPHYHPVCNYCYPDPGACPDRLTAMCGEPASPGPRWFYGENCLECVTAYGLPCPRCGK